MPKQSSSISTLIKTKPVPEKVSNKTISHSQYTIYRSCEHQWYLRYVNKIKPFSSSINTVFGTAMHEVLQQYLKAMYETSIKAADDINIDDLLMERFQENYLSERVKNEGIDFSTQEEMEEFYDDGLKVLHWFKSHRDKFFSIRGWELLGIEVSIMMPTEANPNVFFNGFIDLIMGSVIDGKVIKIIIYDFKTSKQGWKDDREKKDDKKIAQILWYKKYFAKQYEIDEEMVEVVFFIMKRKIWENAEYPQPRIQVFRPAAGFSKTRAANYEMDTFVKECFTPEGEFNLEREFKKNPSPWNCKFCPFNNDLELCDQKVN